MTKEEIYRAYFSNPEVACVCQLEESDLTFANCSSNGGCWSHSNLRVFDFKFTLLSSMYGSFHRLFGSSFDCLPEGFCADQIFETGEVEGWKLVGVSIRNGISQTEGDNFINLIFLRDSADTFNQLDSNGQPLAENYVEILLSDYDFHFLLEQDTDYALLVEYHGGMPDSYSTHTTVTEIINGHKTRVLSGWFLPQDVASGYIWQEISYEVPAE